MGQFPDTEQLPNPLWSDMGQFPDTEQLPNPLWSDMGQFPDTEQLPKNIIVLTGTFVSHVNGWVLLSNGNVQYKYWFPKTDATLSNCQKRRIYRVAQKMYTLFTHQYIWNKFKWNF